MDVLPKSLPRSPGRVETSVRPSSDDPAHMEESGRNIVTRVRTLESMDGRSVVYSKIEKIATKQLETKQLYLQRSKITWNRHSLAAHYEDNLHGSKAT